MKYISRRVEREVVDLYALALDDCLLYGLNYSIVEFLGKEESKNFTPLTSSDMENLFCNNTFERSNEELRPGISLREFVYDYLDNKLWDEEPVNVQNEVAIYEDSIKEMPY